MSPSGSAPRHTFTVSAFFETEAAVNRAVTQLVNQGIPRDLIDVALAARARERFFAGQGQPYRDSIFSFAGRGALAGLVLAAAFTIGLTLMPGFESPGLLAYVQLLGPNIGVMMGGALGGLYGLLRRSHPKPEHYRALERDIPLLLVHLRPPPEAERIAAQLHQWGGIEPRMTPDTMAAVGAE